MTEFELQRAFLAAWGEMIKEIKDARIKAHRRFDEILQEGSDAGIPPHVLTRVLERVLHPASAEADQIAKDEFA